MNSAYTHEQNEIIRLAMEFVLANRDNSKLMTDSEYRELSTACESELSARATKRKGAA